jgi:amidase
MTLDLTRRDFVGAAIAAAALRLNTRLSIAERLLGSSFGLSTTLEEQMDTDLLEITIPGLRKLYEAKKYSATQVTRWYLARIAKYDGVYRALIHVDSAGALATASAQDASRDARGPLWGVPIVIKANTSVKGLVTSAGWAGYLIPGLELVAPMDAPIVARLRGAGAIILGQTNMPDFAASDTNISSAFGRTGNAYDWRFSPGGSSGGTVTAVTANFCVFGNGTDTGNSIRMPAATSEVVGYLPTRGLVSIAGIHPLDVLRDNTGPIARTVTDAAIALDVMAGEDPKDFRTKGSSASAQSGPYTKYLKADALKGKRFGVAAFIAAESGNMPMHPETREAFLKALDGLRAAGATVVIDEAILPESFLALIGAINTSPYRADGAESFLRDFGPAKYHTPAEYAREVGSPLPALVRGAGGPVRSINDPAADTDVWQPQAKALAVYDSTLDRFQLDGYVYPAIQMPPNDELLPLLSGTRSSGPHSRTDWVNPIGVPAVSLPAGFHSSGLPFGLELSAKRWHDGDLLGWAFAFEQATKFRRPPTLRDTR